MATLSTKTIISAIFGAVLITYLITAVFDDVGEAADQVNASLSGASLIGLIPLFLAFGVVIGMYHLLTKGS